MTTLALILALAATSPSFAKNDENVCNSDGKQTTLNGKTHTCGTCASGEQNPTRMGFVGDLTATEAVDACKCYTDKTSDACSDKSRSIISRTQKNAASGKKKKQAAGEAPAGR